MHHHPTADGPEDVDPLLLKAIHGDTNPSLTQHGVFELDGEALQGSREHRQRQVLRAFGGRGALNLGEQVGPCCWSQGSEPLLVESMTQPGWDMRIVDEHGAVVEYLPAQGH